jgi:hypothetical protein
MMSVVVTKMRAQLRVVTMKIFSNQITGRDIVQLKNNIIPKGLVLLEKLFDENDVARNPKITTNDEDVKD